MLVLVPMQVRVREQVQVQPEVQANSEAHWQLENLESRPGGMF
jgi:hypothetical protein